MLSLVVHVPQCTGGLMSSADICEVCVCVCVCVCVWCGWCVWGVCVCGVCVVYLRFYVDRKYGLSVLLI